MAIEANEEGDIQIIDGTPVHCLIHHSLQLLHAKYLELSCLFEPKSTHMFQILLAETFCSIYTLFIKLLYKVYVNMASHAEMSYAIGQQCCYGCYVTLHEHTCTCTKGKLLTQF